MRRLAFSAIMLLSAVVVSTATAAAADGPAAASSPGQVREQADVQAAIIVAKLTPDEKFRQLVNVAPAIPRLGIPAYNWWTESLHGAMGTVPTTNFPAPIGLAATFDEGLVHEVAGVISSENRGLYALARRMGVDVKVDESWEAKREVLKSKPGDRIPRESVEPSASWKPVFFCDEEIPCNPCATVCPTHSIVLKERRGNILDLPYFRGSDCKGCAACVAACPGLAVSLVREIGDGCCEVVLPFEFDPGMKQGDRREILDREGAVLEEAELLTLAYSKKHRTHLMHFKVSAANATKAIGLRVQRPEATAALREPRFSYAPDEAILCRCERVSFGEIVRFIRENEVRDLNQLKSIRAGMGACGSKTCAPLYAAAFRAAGVDPSRVAEGRLRPLEVEVPLGALAAP